MDHVGWLIYQPTYSCTPPPLVLVFLSVSQVNVVYAPYTVGLLIYQPTNSFRPQALVLVFLSVLQVYMYHVHQPTYCCRPQPLVLVCYLKKA